MLKEDISYTSFDLSMNRRDIIYENEYQGECHLQNLQKLYLYLYIYIFINLYIVDYVITVISIFPLLPPSTQYPLPSRNPPLSSCP